MKKLLTLLAALAVTLALAVTAWADYRSEEHTSELQSLFTISYAVSLIGRAHV